MLSPDDTSYGTREAVMRATRAASRRELIKSKRQRQTDILPDPGDGESQDRPLKTASAAAPSYLREENTQLRKELEMFQEQLETLQAQIGVYQSSVDLLDNEIETIHHAHQQEIEQYQQHLREMMDERNQMQDLNQQLERRYQELYHSFQDAVEEEANKMVAEAAQTLVLSPEHAPPLLSDVVKTLESQARQTEDRLTAELLALIHDVQYKAEARENEVVREREILAAERETLYAQRIQFSIQAQERYRVEQARLKGRWTAGLTLISMSLFGLLVVLELIFDSLKFPLAFTLFVPLGVCMLLSYFFAHLHTTGRVNVQVAGQPAKATAKPTKAAAKPTKALAKAPVKR